MDSPVLRHGVKRAIEDVQIPDSKRRFYAPSVAEQEDVEPYENINFFWSGAEKCPQWIADHLSVPRESVPCIEIRYMSPCGVEMMYTIILDYIYHHGVDIDQPAPDTPAAGKKNGKATPKTDRKSGDKADPKKADPKTPTKLDGKTEDKPDGKSAHKEHINPDAEIDGKLISPSDSADGTTGEDVVIPSFFDGDLPVVPDLLGDTDDSDCGSMSADDELANLSPEELKALEKQAALNVRETPGLLSSLTGCLRPVMKRSINRMRGARARDSTAPSFSFGIGVAHTKYRGRTVVAAHVSRGKPSGSRRVLLYAASVDTLKSFCNHAKRWHFRRYRDEKLSSGKYTLHLLDVLPNGKGIWRNAGQKESRPLDSIVLREGQLDAIIADFREFKAPGTKKWYVDHGLPHRRSYLFYGPPGVGKTSTIRALAGELRLTACFLSLSDNHFQNKTLHDAVMNIPKPSMLVIEDIDVLFNENRKAQSNSFVTFSGLLNALDGLVSADGILTIMTTNHPERLDPALTRAGRVDRRFEFKAPDKEQMKNYFLSFYTEADAKLAKKFADIVFSRPEKEARCIATLQEHFIYTRKKTAEECVASVNQFFEEFYPHSKAEVSPTYTM